MQAVRQVVGRLDVDGQSFAPISLHKMDAAPVAFRTNAVCDVL